MRSRKTSGEYGFRDKSGLESIWRRSCFLPRLFFPKRHLGCHCKWSACTSCQSIYTGRKDPFAQPYRRRSWPLFFRYGHCQPLRFWCGLLLTQFILLGHLCHQVPYSFTLRILKFLIQCQFIIKIPLIGCMGLCLRISALFTFCDSAVACALSIASSFF